MTPRNSKGQIMWRIALASFLWILFCMSAGRLCSAQQIAFMRNGDVCVINEDGSQLRKLARDPRYGLNRPIVWRPDGKTILFWSHDSPGWEIWQVTLANQETSRLIAAETGGVRSAVYSHDGSKIAYMRDAPNGVFVCDGQGGASKQITQSGDRDQPPSWSPDGRRLVFESYATTSAGQTRSSIRVVDADGSNLRRLWGGSRPDWCRATNLIYFLGGHDGVMQIFSIDPDATDDEAALTLVTRSNGDKTRPHISPSGHQLAYLARRNDQWLLLVLDVDNATEREVVAMGDKAADFDWSPDGRRLVYASGVQESGGIYVATVEANQIASQKIAEGTAEFLRWNPAWGNAANDERPPDR